MCNQTETPLKTRRFILALAAALPAAIAILLLTGCANDDALIFASNKQLGVKVGVDSKQIPEVSVGYNSQDLAFVPLYKAGMPDGVSGNHAVVAGILREADKNLAAAEAGFTGSSLSEPGRQYLTTADLLIDTALDAGTDEKKEDKEQEDRLLRRIKQESVGLVQNISKLNQQEFKTRITGLRGLIEVEASKPALMAEFSEQLKYIGRQDGDRREDAYSVFGSFSGRGAVKSTGGEVSGGMAQFFATGVAAQLLASEGGAAVVSADAKSPAAYKYDAALVQARLESEHETQLNTAKAQVLEQADLADRLVTDTFKLTDSGQRRELVTTALGMTDGETRIELPDTALQNPDAIRRLARSPERYPALTRHYSGQK